MSTGERATNTRKMLADIKHKSDKCPVCGKRAMARYLDEEKLLWVYKHQRKKYKRFNSWQVESFYHEAKL